MNRLDRVAFAKMHNEMSGFCKIKQSDTVRTFYNLKTKV